MRIAIERKKERNKETFIVNYLQVFCYTFFYTGINEHKPCEGSNKDKCIEQEVN